MGDKKRARTTINGGVARSLSVWLVFSSRKHVYAAVVLTAAASCVFVRPLYQPHHRRATMATERGSPGYGEVRKIEADLEASRREAHRLVESLSGVLDDLAIRVLPRDEQVRHRRQLMSAKKNATKSNLRGPTPERAGGARSPSPGRRQLQQPEWDSRTLVVDPKLLSKFPKPKPKTMLKKKTVKLKDLEKIAAMAPGLSLQDLLDLGQGRDPADRLAGTVEGDVKYDEADWGEETDGYGSDYVEDVYQRDSDGSSEYSDGRQRRGNGIVELASSGRKFEANMASSTRTLATTSSGKKIEANIASSTKTLASTSPASSTQLNRQIRYTTKNLNRSLASQGRGQGAAQRKKMVRKKKKKSLKPISTRKTPRSKAVQREHRSVVAARSKSASSNRVKWHQGDILNGGSPAVKTQHPVPRSILKHSQSLEGGLNTTPNRKPPPARPQSASLRREKTTAFLNSLGSPQWNWAGPLPEGYEYLKKARPVSAYRARTGSTSLGNLNRRPLHLPKSPDLSKYVELPKYTKLLPEPVTSGGKDVEEKKANYRLEHYPEYNRIGEGEMVVTITHCCNCRQHQQTTRHDEAKYVNCARQLAMRIETNIPAAEVIVRPVKGRLIGAFEVQVCRQEAGQLSKTLLHSKLVTHLWPNVENIVNKIKALVPKHELVVNVSAKMDDYNMNGFSDLACCLTKNQGGTGNVSKTIMTVEPVLGNDDGVRRATGTLLVPSGAYTLSVEGSDTFLPINEHVDTTEEVRTVINRVLCERRRVFVIVTCEGGAEKCGAGLRVAVRDKHNGQMMENQTDGNGTSTFDLSQGPEFSTDLHVTVMDPTGKEVAADFSYPLIKQRERSIVHVDMGIGYHVPPNLPNTPTNISNYTFSDFQ